MIWEEWRVAVPERFLTIEGIASENVCNQLFKDFASKKGPARVCCFVSYSYADLPLGKQFEIVYSCSEPSNYVRTVVEIYASTQQMGIETDVVSYGWKTVSIFEFPNGIPDLVKNLPIVSSWYEKKGQYDLCLCNEEIYDAIKQPKEE